MKLEAVWKLERYLKKNKITKRSLMAKLDVCYATLFHFFRGEMSEQVQRKYITRSCAVLGLPEDYFDGGTPQVAGETAATEKPEPEKRAAALPVSKRGTAIPEIVVMDKDGTVVVTVLDGRAKAVDGYRVFVRNDAV